MSNKNDEEVNVIVTDGSKPKHELQNKYLIMEFWEFAILTTLMVVFFPWSLLYCVVVHGLEHTKLIVIAMFHDMLKTLLAVLSIILPIVAVLIYLALSYKNVI